MEPRGRVDCLPLREKYALHRLLSQERPGTSCRRASAFFAVLLAHLVLVGLMMRASRLVVLMPKTDQPFTLLLLPREAPRATEPGAPARPSRPPPKRLRPSEAASANAPSPPPVAPTQPDWEHEAELAAQNSVAARERAENYRDLSGLSATQRDWITRNHMESAQPGIVWRRPRVEYSDGIPVIRINEHCVSVPVMLFMVFCKIGHIEPNGDMLDHMGDGARH